jgi:hypothetical protein
LWWWQYWISYLIIYPFGGLILKLCLVVAILNFIFIHFPIWWSYKNCVLKWWQSWILFLFIIPYGGLILKLCLVVVAILDFIFNHYPIWWSYIKIVSFGGGNIGFWICTKNEIYYFTYIFLYSWIWYFNILSVFREADFHLLILIHWYIIITDLYKKTEFGRNLLGIFMVSRYLQVKK